MFEVQWKAGDVTWLPFDQVDHLGALRDYLDVLGIDDISGLTDGNEVSVSTDVSNIDSHVFLGAMGLGWPDHISRPHNPSPPSTSTSPATSSTKTMSSNPLPTPLFRAQNGVFIMADRYRPGVSLAITLDQLRLYLQYDADLRSGTAPNTIITPIGYDDFAVALNSNAGAGVQVAIVQEGDEGVRITGPPTPRDPREDAGGQWLDSRRSELLDHALWDNLERNKKQRIWRNKSVAKRQAKRRRREDDEAMRPFAPSTSLTNALAGPSGLNNPITPSIPPPPPITPVPDLPAPPVDGEDEEMDDDRAEERAQGKGKGKGLGRIPKK
ncbi:uncharacterized protein HD556DRAFT_1503705 [Suillus plorans]|uniref:Uncharacterized protein n=1 Tax=Suillus plorans TaxID=116603 RepID=A0A9P7AEC6_9AGAM|nr:uncharacterized protein HD556DRAFT_1503705 [Suillus plorans]KAG1787113.1 hypothetical protein HD556DRAFT_1503705 [Suillus plorans]